MNNFKKNLVLLLLSVFSFTVAAAHNKVLPAVPGGDPISKTITKPMGKPMALKVAGANGAQDITIYTRTEYQNISGIAYGSSDDRWYEGQCEPVVRFYTNLDCTIPYTLTSSMTIYIACHFEESYNYGEPEGIEYYHWTYTAPAGYNYVSLGNGASLYADHWTFNGFTWYFVNHDLFYDVEDPGDGSYTAAQSIGRYINVY